MSQRGAYDRRDTGGRQPSDRQREVLDLLVEGKSNAEIAVRLGITVDGAKWHVSELLAETGSEDRQALAAWWRRERRVRAGKTGLFGLLPAHRLAFGAVAVIAGVALLAMVVALTGGKPGPPEPEAALGASPTPWPEEALEALAAQQGPAPATCEPAEAQDLRLVDAGELLAQGLEPAGRVIVSGHCPLYVANRVDRSVVWVGGGGVLHLDEAEGWRMVNLSQFVREDGYQLAAYFGSPGDGPYGDPVLRYTNASITFVRPVLSGGSYLMLSLSAATPTPGRLRHRVAFASDGQMFVDARPLSRETVLNDLTGEEIDVSHLGQDNAMRIRVSEANARTDCWEEYGVCKVYLDGVGAKGDGVFNPPTMLAPFDGVLSCVQAEGGWSGDGPALAYELSNGPTRIRIGAFGGHAEAYEDCQPRDVRRGQELDVWVYTYLEAFVGAEPISLVSTRDGRLFVGEVDLKLICPCEPRS